MIAVVRISDDDGALLATIRDEPEPLTNEDWLAKCHVCGAELRDVDLVRAFDATRYHLREHS